MIEILILKKEEDVADCLAKHFGKAISIQKTARGMPYIPEIAKKISITHKNEHLVVAVSDKAVGVDLEQCNTKKTLKVIAKRFFAKNEVQKAGKGKGFYELWTRKEALGKLLGKGINSHILGVDVTGDSIMYEDTTLYIKSFFDIIKNYCLSLVSEEEINFLKFY